MKNESFDCLFCNKSITRHPSGSARNHCPYCLSSLHVDRDFPGDRSSDCHGEMLADGLIQHAKKGLMILHTCRVCGAKNRNIIAPDDNISPLYTLLNQENTAPSHERIIHSRYDIF